ncbi:alpha-N-acetylgalactosaminide alpha-2,6-sialyltransferase 6 isoform 1-T1 [Ciconia maguari]
MLPGRLPAGERQQKSLRSFVRCSSCRSPTPGRASPAQQSQNPSGRGWPGHPGQKGLAKIPQRGCRSWSAVESPPRPTKSPREGPWAAGPARGRPRHPNNVVLRPAAGQAPRAAPGTRGQRCRPPRCPRGRDGTGQAAGAGAALACPVGARRGEGGARTPAALLSPRAALGPPRPCPVPGSARLPGLRARAAAAPGRAAAGPAAAAAGPAAAAPGPAAGSAAGSRRAAERSEQRCDPRDAPWPRSPEGPGSPRGAHGAEEEVPDPPRRSPPAADESPCPAPAAGTRSSPTAACGAEPAGPPTSRSGR